MSYLAAKDTTQLKHKYTEFSKGSGSVQSSCCLHLSKNNKKKQSSPTDDPGMEQKSSLISL